MKRLARAMLCIAALAGAVAPSATAQDLVCGAEVTSDVTLTASLTGCFTGLVIAADGITVDLNGYAIEGVAADESSGIEAVDRSGLTIKNGSIRGFKTGVRFVWTSGSTVENLSIEKTNFGILLGGSLFGPGSRSNTIVGNTVTDSATGIWLGEAYENVVARNSLTNIEGSGIRCSNGSQNVITRNSSVRNGSGISLDFCSATVTRNVASQNQFSGIYRFRSGGAVEGNVANGNGEWGIYAFDSHAGFLNNVTNGNGRDGLYIGDSNPFHGPGHSISGHVANANGRFGIATDLEGVVDGGKNRARANGDASQCLGFLCNGNGGT